MKKLLFGLIATVTVTNLSFCQTEIQISDYGKIHNEIIELYYKNYGTDFKNVDFKTLLSNELNLMQNAHPDLFEGVDITDLNNSFAIFKSINEFDFLLFWNNYKSKIMQEKEMSSIMIEFMNDISKNNYDYQSLKSKIEKLKNNTNLSENDTKSIAIFSNILESSNDLWSNQTFNSNLSRGNCCNDRIILMDCAGGLMFLAAGPVALLNSAACSLAGAHSGCCN